MKAVSASTLRSSVLKKGFVAVGGTKHERWTLHVDGRKTQWNVKLSHGADELSVVELSLNARHIGVPANELHRVLSCEYDLDQTAALYRTLTSPAPQAASVAGAGTASPEELKGRLAELTELLQRAEGGELDKLIAEYEAVQRQLAG